MRLQYRFIEYIGFKYMIKLYCDGWLVKAYEVWADELDDEIEKVENKGYTYGYTEDELNEARVHYEKMLDNVIRKND